MGGSNESWGSYMEHADTTDEYAITMANVYDSLPQLAGPDDAPGLAELCAERGLDWTDLARTGARLTPDLRELAWIWPGGLKYRNILKGTHRAETGSAFTHVSVVRPAAAVADGPRILLLAEGQTDGARLGRMYPHAHVGIIPQGVDKLPPRTIEQCGEFDQVYICFDADEAGDRGAEKLTAVLPTALRHRPPERQGHNDWCGMAPDAPVPPLPTPGELPKLGYAFYELAALDYVEPEWWIPGLIAKGWLVKVAAREKTGKGTLMFHLLGALEAQEPTLLGPAAPYPITSLIYTEEPMDSVQEKILQQGGRLKGGQVVFHHSLPQTVRSMAPLPRWDAICKLLVAHAVAGGHQLIFVDNISRAAQVDDENGTELSRRADMLAEPAKAAGLTVVIDHHHRKGAGDVQSLSRGGTALAGATDVNLEMVRVGNNTSRKRKLSCVGRIRATCWERTWELSEDGQDYFELAGDGDPDSARDRAWLAAILEHGAVSIKELVELLDEEASPAVLRKWVGEMQDAGHLVYAGKSGKSSTFRVPAKADPDEPVDF